MKFETLEDACRFALYQAAGTQPTVVVNRDGKFWSIPEAEMLPGEAALQRAALHNV